MWPFKRAARVRLTVRFRGTDQVLRSPWLLATDEFEIYDAAGWLGTIQIDEAE